VQVRYDEGVANHIGLEPCAVAREGGGEASVEEHIGQPLSLAKILIPGADDVLAEWKIMSSDPSHVNLKFAA
jgi:hypothetical protein